MAYGQAKVYFDGSHYIAIPPSTRPTAKKKGGGSKLDDEKKKAFEKAYTETKAKSKARKLSEITEDIKAHFKSEEDATDYVAENIERKYRNLIVRRARLIRKLNLGIWNYFCTFTYDDKKQTEESFKRKLSDCFKKMCYRRDWVYIGVWERAPKTGRLHFHGIFYIPEGAMVGEITEHRDYSTKSHEMQTTYQNSYFTERFGRNDFEPLDTHSLGDATAYLIKYIEKSGERIVYSKNTPTYFISDILEDDVVCTIGQEDRKLLLFDDFSCFADGVYMGEVSREVIAKMPKSN